MKSRSSPQRGTGFTYLGLLLAVAVIGIGLTAASELWVAAARRQKLEQLEWVGQQYVKALGSYHAASPGAAKVYPQSLQDLLEDRRHLVLRRHIRRLYGNPMSGQAYWELVKDARGGIYGVRARPSDTDGRDFEFLHRPHLIAERVASRTWPTRQPKPDKHSFRE